MVILTTIYVVVAVLLLFASAIFIHEWGHFFVARKCGMKVEEFAIGFGKILWKREKDGVLYTIRMIPAGGFVKLPQMITSETIEGKNEEETEPLPEISPWAKIAVAVAGPIMNVVFAFVLATIIYFVGLPEAITPPIVGSLDEASEEYKEGVREGDIIIEIDGKKIPSWEEARKLTALALTNRFSVTFQRQTDSGIEEFTRNLIAKPVSEELAIKILQLPPKFRPIAGKVLDGGAAATAGLKANDEIISLGGLPLDGQGQLISALQKNGTNETEIAVLRDGNKVSLAITPKMVNERVMIGVQFAAMPLTYVVRHPGPSPVENVKGVASLMWDTLNALFNKSQTGVGVKDLSGPVGILAMLGAWVKTDYRLALNFLVLLNVNLAILNMLPIPVLDGGHTVMGLFEGIFRRKIPAKLLEIVTIIFTVLLLSLMAYITFHDVFERSGLFVDMFNNDVEIQGQPNSDE
ncbi:MAG: RIP metalloprotease RseP [Verrucomicrobiota bacterium]|nr:RIP metalloprotease RseP [Verrucomicrobiota bacterium]